MAFDVDSFLMTLAFQFYNVLSLTVFTNLSILHFYKVFPIIQTVFYMVSSAFALQLVVVPGISSKQCH